ncbi:MAG TPA: 6-phosphogluconolactonase, partial [Ilumatobacteraceae bacterium]|nr:6-phosphogluconolactonase [Ilumatobacteraceae bacterium]
VAAQRYATDLPDRLDVVHLGIGDDGHTASWPPGDPVIEASDRVALSGEYKGRVRMTLTVPAVNAARHRLVLATGTSKAPVVERWLLDDRRLPIDRVRRANTTVILDAAAAARLPFDLPAATSNGRRRPR